MRREAVSEITVKNTLLGKKRDSFPNVKLSSIRDTVALCEDGYDNLSIALILKRT